MDLAGPVPGSCVLWSRLEGRQVACTKLIICGFQEHSCTEVHGAQNFVLPHVGFSVQQTWQISIVQRVMKPILEMIFRKQGGQREPIGARAWAFVVQTNTN